MAEALAEGRVAHGAAGGVDGRVDKYNELGATLDGMERY